MRALRSITRFDIFKMGKPVVLVLNGSCLFSNLILSFFKGGGSGGQQESRLAGAELRLCVLIQPEIQLVLLNFPNGFSLCVHVLKVGIWRGVAQTLPVICPSLGII